MNRDNKSIIPSFKMKLLQVNSLHLVYTNNLDSSFNAEGSATVTSTNEAKDVVYCIEKGSLARLKGESFAFYNHYSYTFKKDSIELAHMRRGTPVKLCLLYPRDNSLVSSLPYCCKEDLYSCKIGLTSKGFSLAWEIKGPHKSEKVCCSYVKSDNYTTANASFDIQEQ